ncbi:FAD-dependent oxidoreductase [Bradyrhizobium sp. RDI18]|uniref:FAD-dependent oxidoreductase n=1 Tax=Bradyrhizobium sp. RDI18 TaxID=3367400 RepID=UPI003711DFC2
MGGGNYTGALLDKRAGTIQPLAYVRGLARVTLAAVAKIFTQSEVLTAINSGLRWRIGTAKGSVSAEWVIVATNAYGRDRGRRFGRSRSIFLLQFCHRVSDHLRASILPERQGVWDTREVLSSFRLDRSGGIDLPPKKWTV